VPAHPCCPIHHEPLRLDGADLVGTIHSERYPVVGGVPVLIANRDERRKAAETDWLAGDASSKGSSPLHFYNRSENHDGYCREALEEVRSDMDRYLRLSPAVGPVLEIGSGKGALQGFGGDYTACDYSLSAVSRHVSSSHARVCASAESLPFLDGTFRFIFTIATLEHVPGVDRAFSEIHRVLAPGGVAYLAPAWHCVQYNCEGIPVRPYSDLDLRQKFIKATLPIRKNLLVKAAGTLPQRLLRRSMWARAGGQTEFRFERLRPDYETFWMSDSDAASRIDSHEGCLFFHSRGYQVLSPGTTALAQLTDRHGPVVVKKASA
jgi:SAM-dependent methyltransferase